MLPSWMQKRQVNYGQEVQVQINDVFQTSTTKDLAKNLTELRKEYPFEIAVYLNEKQVYQTLPGMSFSELRNTLSDEVVVIETQGYIDSPSGNYKVWYSVYHLKPQQYFDSIFFVQMAVMVISFILVLVISFLLQNRLVKPLHAVKRSLEQLENYRFDELEIEMTDDEITKGMQRFATNLQHNIKAVSREHTELERALQLERERLQNMITVSRGIVHDLKSPVHQTLLENEYTLNHTKISKETQVALQYNVERMDALLKEINGVLQLMDTGVEQMMEEIDHFDVIQLFKDVKKVFEIEISQKQLSFFTIMDETLIVDVNKVSVHLIIHNLLSNAVKYATNGTSIDFELHADEQYLHLRCENETEVKNLERILSSNTLFQTVKADDETGGDYVYSTGNGLYLLRELSALLHGRYALEIEGESTVVITIKLPL